MALIRQLDKRTGITYVYESESWWDGERKMSRSRRGLFGRLDPEAGEVVPTNGRMRRAAERKARGGARPEADLAARLEALEVRVAELEARLGDD